MVARKSLKILMVCACAIALTLVVSSCKKDSDEPAEQPTTPETKVPTTPETTPTTETTEKTGTVKPVEPPKAGDDRLLVVPLVGLGPVRFGMSKDQVILHLGEPDRMEAGGMMIQYVKSKGISLMLDPARGVRSIDCWSTDHPHALPGMTSFAGKTTEGIAMGAGREQIVAAYGEPAKTVPRGNLEVLSYDKLGVEFMLSQNGRLVNMRIRAPR
jgi:hypothetical protein